MTTREVTAKELKELDPKLFEKEYYEWQEYAGDYFAEGVQEGFTEDMAKFGLRVDDIEYSGFYHQGSFARFTGRINIAEWMEAVGGMSVQYPALYLGVKDDGSYARVTTLHRMGMTIDIEEWAHDAAPSGVFSGLDQEAWSELVEEQGRDADLERELEKWCEDMAGELYKTLETAYEWAVSEEQFLESCEANETMFEVEEEEEEEEATSVF